MTCKSFIPHYFLFLILISFYACDIKEEPDIVNEPDEEQEKIVKDQDGNDYSIVVIGDQKWMVENLRTTTYANGDPIENISNVKEWMNLETGAWSHIGNNSRFEDPYGKLYNWFSVADPRNICPKGWHIPGDDEWKKLTDYLGGDNLAGSKMKSTKHWQITTWATNTSGFSALPGGAISEGGGLMPGPMGFYWSSTEYDSKNAWRLSLYDLGQYVNRYYESKNNGYSCRCLKD